MMKNTPLLLLIAYLLFSTSCSTHRVEGLWLVEKVKIGQEKMTPQARWTRFNKDHSQQSGNGWTQHSIGTWQVDKATKTLRIVNTNGYVDSNEPFKFQVDNNTMRWKRSEEGQQVEVILKRVSELPQGPFDRLLGVWKLKKVSQGNNDLTAEYDPQGKRYLFFRWDKIFDIRHTQNGRMRGIYRTHGHRPEVEFIYYGSNERQTWRFEAKQNKLLLTREVEGQKLKMEYERIDHFIGG